jgi:hypothetical protein
MLTKQGVAMLSPTVSWSEGERAFPDELQNGI